MSLSAPPRKLVISLADSSLVSLRSLPMLLAPNILPFQRSRRECLESCSWSIFIVKKTSIREGIERERRGAREGQPHMPVVRASGLVERLCPWTRGGVVLR